MSRPHTAQKVELVVLFKRYGAYIINRLFVLKPKSNDFTINPVNFILSTRQAKRGDYSNCALPLEH